MKRLASDHCVYSMDRSNAPAIAIEPGENIVVETQDCYSNTVKTQSDSFRPEDWDRVNPATGPIEVKGAEPGDVLVVKVMDLQPRSPGTMVQQEGVGGLKRHVRETKTRKTPIRDGVALFNRKVRIPIRPMIGVIGTAPKGKPVLNGAPGPHGGNMDCNLIGKGARVYLPVNVPGALLALGDVHAVQGNGEVLICALECRARIRLKVSLLKQTRMPLPMVETSRVVAPMYSAKTLETCERGVLAMAWEYLTKIRGVPEDEAGFLMSLAGDLEINQIVDPLKTMRFEMPKSILKAYRVQSPEADRKRPTDSPSPASQL